jgi:uncharacterized membrane protein (DUF485 family)
MRKYLSLLFLVILFCFALLPQWSILSIGQSLAKNQEVATLLIQAFLVILAGVIVAFIYFNLPITMGKKKREE